MRTETTIRAVDAIEKATRSGRRINGLFRLLGNPDVLWKQAYANLYSNKGAITKGVDNNTLDGFSEERVNHLIRKLCAKEYRFAPARRIYIPKKNGKLRPLGIPTGDDKLVQEVVRLLLEQIYEPIFSENSHGFRPGRSCHTALQQAKINSSLSPALCAGEQSSGSEGHDTKAVKYQLKHQVRSANITYYMVKVNGRACIRQHIDGPLRGG